MNIWKTDSETSPSVNHACFKGDTRTIETCGFINPDLVCFESGFYVTKVANNGK